MPEKRQKLLQGKPIARRRRKDGKTRKLSSKEGEHVKHWIEQELRYSGVRKGNRKRRGGGGGREKSFLEGKPKVTQFLGSLYEGVVL